MPSPDYRYAVGTFSRSLTPGDQIVSGIADAAGAFTPKVVLFFSAMTPAGGGFVADGRAMIGFSDGSGHRAIATFKENAITGLRGTRSYVDNTSCVCANTAAPTTISDTGFVQAFGPGQFTVRWSANDGAPWDIHYLAIGGADVMAKVLTVLAPAAAGTQVVTGVGIGPVTGLIALGVWATQVTSLGVATVGLDAHPLIGFTDGVEQAANSVDTNNFVSTTVTDRWQRADYTVVQQFNDGPPNPGAQVAISSFDSDGFTLRWDLTSYPGPHGNAGLFCLALSGPALAVGTVAQDVASLTLPFVPGALLLSSVGAVSATAIQTDSRWSLAAAGVSAQAGIWLGDLDAQGTSAAARRADTATVPTAADPVAVTASSVLHAAAAVTLTPTGATFTWPTSDHVLRELIYCAFEQAPIVPPPPVVPVEGCVVDFPSGGPT